jgi:hypothetical protein
LDRYGYLRTHFTIDGIHTTLAVARVVCAAFHGPPPDAKSQVNHKNGVRSDDRAENLEWVTFSGNQLHSYKELKRVAGFAKLTPGQAVAIYAEATAIDAPSQKQIADKYRVHKTIVNRIVRGELWSRWTGAKTKQTC